MERQCRVNAQYSRRECLELVSVPRSVSDGDLEENVLKIFEKVGCSIEENNIEACHWTSKKKKIFFALKNAFLIRESLLTFCCVFILDYVLNCQLFINPSQ